MVSLVSRLQTALSYQDIPSFDGDLDKNPQVVRSTKQAAVLILVNDFYQEPTITLTQRTETLRNHSGQVAFPGGRVDETDRSAWDAALRETHEEIGLPRDHPLIRIGSMDNHHTITGYEVKPFVAVNEHPFEIRPERGEVAEVFEIPLSLVRVENFQIDTVHWQGRDRRYFVLPFENYYIWGATARMLYQLGIRLEKCTTKM